MRAKIVFILRYSGRCKLTGTQQNLSALRARVNSVMTKLTENIIKVGVLEERMTLNLLSIALARAQSPRRVTGQELIWVKCELKSMYKGHDVPFEVLRRHREA